MIKLLEKKYGAKLKPSEYNEDLWGDDTIFASYLVWMCQEIQGMTDSDKAGRWIGWVFGAMQFRLRLMNNAEARDAAREDAHR